MSCRNYYTKRDYAGNHAGFGVGAVFMFIGLVSLVMQNAGIQIFGLYAWGHWLFIPAFFILIGSTAQVPIDKRIRQDVTSLLAQGGNRKYTLDEIAIEANVKYHCVLRVLMDLRDLGIITYTYDARSGEIMAGNQAIYPQVTVYQPVSRRMEPVPTQFVQKKYHFCTNCGQMLEDITEKKYCPACGSLLP